MDPYSFLNTAHTAYFAELYDQYLVSPESVEPSWRAFFQGFEFGIDKAENGEIHVPENILKEFKVVKLINGYRTRGHLFTNTNPVRDRRTYKPNLNLENFELSEGDLIEEFNAGEIIGIGRNSLQNIIIHLERIYCTSIGIEYMYIRTPERIKWIQDYLNKNDNKPELSKDDKKRILKKLIQANNFETFLHKKYVGQKRFSLEGGESLIPALDSIIELASEKGVKEFVLGMAHRGRLNTLCNIFGKSAREIFSEFDGKDYEDQVFDGDVKYHLGWTSKRKSDKGFGIYLNIAPNPSHLESVGPVVEGIARAKQDKYFEDSEENVLPVIIHGDAAIAAQGVVYEFIQMERLKGFSTHGTIHVVVNNQVGFTTNYVDGRSSTYCTDVGKVNLCPILHVNSDDVEAVVHASRFALEYRMKFKRDVFIDLLGYRKYGHNEGDEPRFTQPKLYKTISKHPNAKDIYSQKLIDQKVISREEFFEMERNYLSYLDTDLIDSKKDENVVITPFMEHEWVGFSPVKVDGMLVDNDTSISKESLDQIANSVYILDNSDLFIKKVSRLMKERNKMYNDDRIDWGIAENLAYGSLLKESYNVRVSGQDVERGTFSHRHAILKTELTEENFIPLNNISKFQGKFEIYNSSLSEYAVMGFEYGYALSNPNTLTVWEAQFGDFSNGAQIIIDQYLSAAEDKWKLQNGLVLMLPHGYEGQGAEHSSARIERYLQLCAKDNMYIANCTTPSNLFHIIRRQMITTFRKPLVLFTPKSLLRHPKVISTTKDLYEGKFHTVIDDSMTENNIKSLVFCSGKFYYDLIEYREKNQISNVAIVRIEQLFPLPEKEIKKIISKYNADEIVWAQEEPRNMGSWGYLLLHLDIAKDFRVASRRFYGSPAAGSPSRFKKRHMEVIKYVFDKAKPNY